MADLNNTLIAIRERSLWEICDLGLQVVRGHARTLLLAGAAGMVPFALFNWWYLRNLPLDTQPASLMYTYRLILLMYYELPLATALLTLILGQIMFQRLTNFRRALGEWRGSLPQLLWYQGFLRFLLFPQAFFWDAARGNFNVLLALLMLSWLFAMGRLAYLNEVILLERNPWRGQKGQLSTGQRNKALHGGDFNMIFTRGAALWLVELQLVLVCWLGIWFFRGQFSAKMELGPTMYTILFPLVFWLVSIYLTVVKFLCYLDLRIRREGWEVELALRAEAEHLMRGGPDAVTAAPRTGTAVPGARLQVEATP